MNRKLLILKNGPLVVHGIDVLYSQKGNPIELSDGSELCRCGESFSKPFCDGNHIIFEFDEDQLEKLPDQPTQVYEGEHITVFFDKNICSHRGICYESLPEVFKMLGPVGILPDNGTCEDIIDVCKKCPSGALYFQLKGERVDKSAESGDWHIRLAPKRYGYDGPLEVRGEIECFDAPTSHFSLCRCGHSKNMPFCSGAHWAVHFTDENNDE